MSGPDVWGPHGWKFIHYVTLGYPYQPSQKDKMDYLNFFETLKNVIPCSICGNHFKQHMKIFPLTDEILSDKKKFIEWGINMHNLVNETNGKRIYTFEEGFKEIENAEEKCEGEDKNLIEKFNIKKHSNYIYIIGIIAILILSLIIYRKKLV
jgi:hypothetical protein